MMSRRNVVKAAGLALGGFVMAPLVRPRHRHFVALQVIEMRGDALGAQVWFDPIGLYVHPGTTVRWVVRENVHTTTAYHPRNDKHSLRMPAGATPWDSGYLVHPQDHFDVTLTVPGVYDYFCTPHEGAGMVGRIVVGQAGGPGAEPFDYWVGRAGTDDWREVPGAARAAFPSVARILREHQVHPEATGS